MTCLAMKKSNDHKWHVFFVSTLFVLFFSVSIQAAQVQVRIATGNDDAEQSLTDGTMYLGSEGPSSGFLELGYYFWRRDVGLRFQNVTIPQGSTINSAVVELTAAATDTTNTRLTVTAEAADDAAVFTSANNNISSRTTTAFNVDWNVSNWSNSNTYQSPDIATAIQEVVSRAGWVSGNSMVVIVGPDTACSNSNCDRRAEEFESGASDAALLIIDYTPPVVAEHFAISHDGSADTCNAESVTISKHDTSHTVETGYTGTITLSTSTGNGVWSLLTGAGTLTDLGGGTATYTYVGSDNGQVELGLSNSVSEALNIDVTDGSWNENASEDADLPFSGSVAETFRDEFNTVSFTGSDGTQPWSGGWSQISDGGGANGGDVTVETDLGSGRLHIQDDGNGVVRELNLSSYAGATVNLGFDYRRDSFEANDEYVTIEVSNDGGSSWTTLDSFVGPADDATYASVSYDISTYIAANTQIRFISSAAMSNWDDFYIDNVNVDVSLLAVCPGTDHFDIDHDLLGINCVSEPVSVTAELLGGATDTGYTGTIILDTQSGAGTWALNAGSGSFTDATADDGLASYTFSAADLGVASFTLDYQSGTPSIDVDVYEGVIRDDDTEGSLVFSPSGFTVTAAALSNPPPGVINTVIPGQTAATDFQLYLAAYGTTPTDSTCGIIETYTGAKNLKFWSTYNNPGMGTLPVTVNTVNAFASEAAADLGGTQSVTFTNGQASISTNYADVGQISLAMKDDTVTVDLPAGIRGASDAFVVKPAGFVLGGIQRSSDSFANPGTAIDENGAAFMAAGDNFSVTVTAVNAVGAATPNYGQESAPESVLLTPTLVAAGAANNPAIAFTTGFDGFVAGIDSGTDFHWDEVGIITLTPSVADGNYLGAGDVTGTVSANVGRFYPDHFITGTTPGSFANICTTATAFTYLGESFTYLGSPTVVATAMSANPVAPPLANYTGVWAKLTTGGVSLTYPVADNSQLDEGGATPIAVTSTPGTLSRVDNANGSLTFTLGGGSADSFAYVRNAGQVAPFTSDLSIQLTAVSDGEASASNLGTPKDITPVGNLQRFGRGDAQDVHGTMSQVGNSLLMPVRSWYFNATGGWTLNTDDSCTTYSYSKTDTSITATAVPASPVTLASGVGDLTLTLTNGGNPGGSSVVNTVWPSWLQYDFDGTDQLGDGNLYDDDASATATFGIFRGDDRYLYWREAP